MQPYRQVKPHDSASCWLCAPEGPGHNACQHDGCDEIAELQHPRHATDAEYAAIPEDLRPIDAVAHVAVFTCGDHAVDPVCGPDHQVGPADPLHVECSKCGSAPGMACVKADGSPRRIQHEDRVSAVSLGTRCDHIHRSDCGGLGACQCRPDDPAPERPVRALTPLP